MGNPLSVLSQVALDSRGGGHRPAGASAARPRAPPDGLGALDVRIQRERAPRRERVRHGECSRLQFLFKFGGTPALRLQYWLFHVT